MGAYSHGQAEACLKGSGGGGRAAVAGGADGRPVIWSRGPGEEKPGQKDAGLEGSASRASAVYMAVPNSPNSR